MKNANFSAFFWGLLRLSMGWTFLWAYFDKLLGLGFATCRSAETGAIDFFCNSAWINGGSPTMGFLSHGTKGPFAEIFKAMAGNPVVDALFMIGLLGIGLGMLLGIAVRLGGYSGFAMMVLMYLAGSILPANNLFMDEHVIYAILLLAFTYVGAGKSLGLGKKWSQLKLVKKYPILQ